MRISIHQPAYLPWLGYIEKMNNCDIFIYLDTVQFSKNSFDNRNRILLNGKDHWLTIPIRQKLGQTYLETEAVNYDFFDSHLATIKQAYGKSKNFKEVFPRLEKLYVDCRDTCNAVMSRAYDNKPVSLSEICWWMLGFFEMMFHTKCVVSKASTQNFYGKGSDLILNICQKFGADEYYSGVMGKDYLDEEKFKKAGIKIIYQDYKPPNYYASIHQLFTEGGNL